MNTIHLGNYEEFFVLYMDNELNANQMKMVDEFLAAHPDLKAELAILMSTKLPMEEFSFEKNELLAESMKASSVNEELLLYIDNELSDNQKKTVEIELAANKDYQLQHQLLLQTKLDPSERISYPNKKALYHKTANVISIKVWMRVAAAVVIIAIGGIVYFTNPPGTVVTPADESVAGTEIQIQNQGNQNDSVSPVVVASETPFNNEVAIKEEKSGNQRKAIEVKTVNPGKEEQIPEQNLIALVTPQEKSDETFQRPKVSSVQVQDNENNGLKSSKDILNTGPVTSLDLERKTIKETPEELGETANRKGSFKGFLRKATRVIEKRTGIDPTNGDGDLLIGVVAINLK